MDLETDTSEDGIVVFDGICSFCSGAVRFILTYDTEGRLAFAPMQSRAGEQLLERHGLDPADVQTFLFVRGSEAFVRSDAALEIARYLPRWRWLRILRVVPRAIRDAVYSVVSRNRYRWFGKREACFLPQPEDRHRFLDDGP